MPNRILREGILTSERVEMLNWAEEVFYRRLMSVVDDYGRYYARPSLILAACYPLLLKKVSDSDIEKWLSACENAALVRVYPASDGKRYLQLLDFKQQVRATVSKFPQMSSSCAADAQQLQSSAHLDVSVDVSEGEDSSDALPGSKLVSEFSIPLNDSSEYRVPQAQFTEWAALFPAISVERELREMRAWSQANPTKRKTRRGVAAFAVRWLSKAQDNPGRGSGTQNSDPYGLKTAL